MYFEMNFVKHERELEKFTNNRVSIRQFGSLNLKYSHICVFVILKILNKSQSKFLYIIDFRVYFAS